MLVQLAIDFSWDTLLLLSKFCHRPNATSTVSTTIEVSVAPPDGDEASTPSSGSGMGPNIAQPKL